MRIAAEGRSIYVAYRVPKPPFGETDVQHFDPTAQMAMGVMPFTATDVIPAGSQLLLAAAYAGSSQATLESAMVAARRRLQARGVAVA